MTDPEPLSTGKIRKIPGVVRVEWDIENYTELCEGKDERYFFMSPSFDILAATWYFVLHPNSAICSQSSGYMSLSLRKCCSKVKEHQIYYRTGIKINGNQKFFNISENRCLKQNETAGLKEFFLTDDLQDLKPDDTLAVFLYAYPLSSALSEFISLADSTDAEFQGIDILSRNMEDLFLAKQDCDFTIKVKDKEFKVHKAILSARSPVLASMLHPDMAEKSSIIEIVDSEPGDFEDLLRYLYSGRVDNLSWNNAMRLFTLGDRYDLEHLKRQCCAFMVDNICYEEFCGVAAFAVKHGESKLVRCAEEFFVENIKYILSTKKWKQFLEEKPTICNELFMKFVSAVM